MRKKIICAMLAVAMLTQISACATDKETQSAAIKDKQAEESLEKGNTAGIESVEETNTADAEISEDRNKADMESVEVVNTSDAEAVGTANTTDEERVLATTVENLPVQDTENEHTTERKMRAAYELALQDLLFTHMLPVYGDVDVDPDVFGSFEKNQYAIFDVDGDGQKELIVNLVSAPMAGTMQIVFRYNESANILEEEFCAFPATTFYENGAVRAEWSHNQGYAGDALWPYTLYQYNQDTDSYDEVSMVDAWDHSFELGAAGFPAEYDADGDGIVYIMIKDGGETIIDNAEYESFWQENIGDAKTIDIPFEYLTEENVNSIVENN